MILIQNFKVPWIYALFSNLEWLKNPCFWLPFLNYVEDTAVHYLVLESLYSSFVCLLAVVCVAGYWTTSKVIPAASMLVTLLWSVLYIEFCVLWIKNTVYCNEVWKPLLWRSPHASAIYYSFPSNKRPVLLKAHVSQYLAFHPLQRKKYHLLQKPTFC